MIKLPTIFHKVRTLTSKRVSEEICFNGFLAKQCRWVYFLSNGEGQLAGEKHSLSHMGLEAEMFSQLTESLSSKDRRAELRTFDATADRRPLEPSEGSGRYNTEAMTGKIQENQQLYPLAEPP